MSFLNTLNRSSHSPIIDYHLSIMKNSKPREDVQSFFGDETVQNLRTHITMVNLEMRYLERQYISPSKTPSNIIADREELHQEWHNSIQCYQSLKKNSSLFSVDTIHQSSSERNSTVPQTSDRVKMLNTEPEEAKNVKILSNKDFILSIAGMFTSGYSDTSENVKSIISESIQEKHGMNHGNNHR